MLELSQASSFAECTALIQQAIDDAAANGGGRVVIPPGDWTITSLFLATGVTLELSTNARLIAHDDLAAYPKSTEQDNNKDRQPYHLIIAENCHDVTICGDGIIDGNGMAFWDPPMRQLAAEGIDVPAYAKEHNLIPAYHKPNHPWYREKKARVSPMLEAKHVTRLRLRGVTFANSPGWTVHCHDCSDLVIDGITIANNLYGPNTDGLDLNGCQDVRIANCDLTCGDDAIILKSMADARPCERIVVTNCIISTNCAALGLGAEVVHAIRDVAFSNCIIRQALRAFQIEMWDTGVIENVVVSNITGTCHTEIPLQRALYIDVNYNNINKASDKTINEEGKWGYCRNVQFSNIVLHTRGRCVFTAPDGGFIDNVVLRDVHLLYDAIEDASETVPQYSSNQMSNHCPEARVANAAVVAQNVDRLQLHNVMTTWPGQGRQADNSAEANQPLNPHHSNPAMHGLWARGCSNLIDNSPFLQGFQAEDRKIAE